MFLSILKRERERDSAKISERHVTDRSPFLNYLDCFDTLCRNNHETFRIGHANGQERLGTNNGKRSSSRFKKKRNTVLRVNIIL